MTAKSQPPPEPDHGAGKQNADPGQMVHDYTFYPQGRIVRERAEFAPGTLPDAGVPCISRTYDAEGRLTSETSWYAAAEPTGVAPSANPA